jgi:hypothetical protein
VNTAPITILVTSRPEADRTNFKQRPGIAGKLLFRFAAEFTSGPFKGQSVTGYDTAEAAIGALIFGAAEKCENAEQVLALVAMMFDRPGVRSVEESLGRAVRFASKRSWRKHPGVKVRQIDPQLGAKAPSPESAGKGGAA